MTRLVIEVALTFLLALWITVIAQRLDAAENVYAVVLFRADGPVLMDYPTKSKCLWAYRRNVMEMGLRLDPDECDAPIEKAKVDYVRGLIGPDTFTRE